MPSQSVLEQKKAIVAELSERLKSSITGVVVSYEGINTEDDTKLRKELRENDVKYTVVKNTLLSRACEEAGLDDNYNKGRCFRERYQSFHDGVKTCAGAVFLRRGAGSGCTYRWL